MRLLLITMFFRIIAKGQNKMLHIQIEAEIKSIWSKPLPEHQDVTSLSMPTAQF